MLKRFPPPFAVSVGLVLFSAPARAQNPSPPDDPTPPEQPTAESRADPGTAASSQATDQQPPAVQKVRNYIEKSPIVQRLKGDGFYPRIGGLSPGSGLAGGGGYRRHLDWAYVDVSGALSTKAYRGGDATLGWIDSRYVDVSTKLTL